MKDIIEITAIKMVRRDTLRRRLENRFLLQLEIIKTVLFKISIENFSPQ